MVNRFSISATTRPPRTGEEHGREYFYTREDFEAMIEQGAMLGMQKSLATYGSPMDPVDRAVQWE